MQNLSIKLLTVEDLIDAPSGAWKDKLSYAFNRVLTQLYNGLNNQLTPEQNCQEQTATFSIIGSATPSDNTYQFTTKFAFQPTFVEWYVVRTDNGIKANAIEITGNYLHSTFFISGIAGLENAVPYFITVRLWFPPILPPGQR